MELRVRRITLREFPLIARVAAAIVYLVLVYNSFTDF
jgi:hypothetical protein